MPAFDRIVVVALALLFGHSSGAFAQSPVKTPPPLPASAREADGFIAEPDLVRRATLFADRHFSGGEFGEGLYVDLKNLIPGAGWLGGGPGYRRWYAHDRLVVDASAGTSWRAYNTAQARVELPRMARSRLALGSQIRWQDFTQVSFFGEGPNTLESNVSEYRLRSTDLVGYATLRPVQSVGITATIGRLSPTILPRAGRFMRDRPDTRQVAPANIVFAVADQPAFEHSELSMTADTRDFPGHPTTGGLLRAAAAHYSDRDAGRFSFNRYEIEGERFLPLAESRVVIAVHGWLVASATEPGQFVPFYLQPGLGGNQSLRSYAEYRFHDRQLLSVNVEARVALMRHVDAAILFDAGSVSAQMSDLGIDRRSYGGGLRLHTRRQTFARFDVAHGGEGWRALFSMSDPLSLSRVSRRTAPAPFVP